MKIKLTVNVEAPEGLDVEQILTDYIFLGIERDRDRSHDGDEEATQSLQITWGGVVGSFISK